MDQQLNDLQLNDLPHQAAMFVNNIVHNPHAFSRQDVVKAFAMIGELVTSPVPRYQNTGLDLLHVMQRFVNDMVG